MAKKYFKLGDKASLFVDAKSGVKITPGKPAEVTSAAYMTSPTMIKAKKNSHIEEITQAEYEEMTGAPVAAATAPAAEEETPLSKLSKDELLVYLSENYELTTEDMEKYAAMKKKDLLAEIATLDN